MYQLNSIIRNNNGGVKRISDIMSIRKTAAMYIRVPLQHFLKEENGLRRIGAPSPSRTIEKNTSSECNR